MVRYDLVWVRVSASSCDVAIPNDTPGQVRPSHNTAHLISSTLAEEHRPALIDSACWYTQGSSNAYSILCLPVGIKDVSPNFNR